MSHAISGMPARPVVLDWRHGTVGELASCVLCGQPALNRSPATGAPCHKACAETWIAAHARDTGHRAQLIRRYTPGRGELR